MPAQPLLPILMLAVLLFAVGLELRLADPSRLKRMGRPLMLLLVLQWLLLPGLTVLGISLLLPAEQRQQGVALGLALSLLLPAGKSALGYVLLARADVALTLAATLAGLVLTALLSPLWLLALQADHITPPQYFVQGAAALAALTLGLVGAGWLVAQRLPGAQPWLLRACQAGIVIALAFALTQAGKDFSAHITPAQWRWLGLVVVGTHAAVMLVATLAGRALHLAAGERQAVVIAVGITNGALALPLVSLLAPGDVLAQATVLLWGLWRLLVAAVQVLAWRLMASRAAASQVGNGP